MQNRRDLRFIVGRGGKAGGETICGRENGQYVSLENHIHRGLSSKAPGIYLAPVTPCNSGAESSCGKHMAQAVRGRQVQADGVRDLGRSSSAGCALLPEGWGSQGRAL